LSGLLSRRAWFGVAGATAAATLTACASTKSSSTAITVPATLAIPTETGRPVITDPEVALNQLMDGNQPIINAQMQRVLVRTPNIDSGCPGASSRLQ
jgi:carbonic anhydrase